MNINFKKMEGLIPVVVQDAFTGKVLMLGYMNEAALAQTVASGRVTFFSRSKNRLWTKGETSGNFLELVSMQEDCDGDAILVKAKPLGQHTGKGVVRRSKRNSLRVSRQRATFLFTLRCWVWIRGHQRRRHEVPGCRQTHVFSPCLACATGD